jgi:hypothetical protein
LILSNIVSTKKLRIIFGSKGKSTLKKQKKQKRGLRENKRRDRNKKDYFGGDGVLNLMNLNKSRRRLMQKEKHKKYSSRNYAGKLPRSTRKKQNLLNQSKQGEVFICKSKKKSVKRLKENLTYKQC